MTTGDIRPAQVKITTTRSGDYWVLVPHETAEVAIVNEMGRRVFQTCDGSHSCQEIAQRLATETRTDVNRVLTDVVAFVDPPDRLLLPQGAYGQLRIAAHVPEGSSGAGQLPRR